MQSVSFERDVIEFQGGRVLANDPNYIFGDAFADPDMDFEGHCHIGPGGPAR